MNPCINYKLDYGCIYYKHAQSYLYFQNQLIEKKRKRKDKINRTEWHLNERLTLSCEREYIRRKFLILFFNILKLTAWESIAFFNFENQFFNFLCNGKGFKTNQTSTNGTYTTDDLTVLTWETQSKVGSASCPSIVQGIV